MRNSRSVIGHWFLAVCLLCAGCFLFAGCASHSKKHPPQDQKPGHRLVGTIVSVNKEQRFVLIDTQSSYPAPAGEALKFFSNGGETGVLAVSPEVRPPFMIADIVSGSPQKGDQVFE